MFCKDAGPLKDEICQVSLKSHHLYESYDKSDHKPQECHEMTHMWEGIAGLTWLLRQLKSCCFIRGREADKDVVRLFTSPINLPSITDLYLVNISPSPAACCLADLRSFSTAVNTSSSKSTLTETWPGYWGRMKSLNTTGVCKEKKEWVEVVKLNEISILIEKPWSFD